MLEGVDGTSDGVFGVTGLGFESLTGLIGDKFPPILLFARLSFDLYTFPAPSGVRLDFRANGDSCSASRFRGFDDGRGGESKADAGVGTVFELAAVGVGSCFELVRVGVGAVFELSIDCKGDCLNFSFWRSNVGVWSVSVSFLPLVGELLGLISFSSPFPISLRSGVGGCLTAVFSGVYCTYAFDTLCSMVS
jgi:hypothetical protein